MTMNGAAGRPPVVPQPRPLAYAAARRRSAVGPLVELLLATEIGELHLFLTPSASAQLRAALEAAERPSGEDLVL